MIGKVCQRGSGVRRLLGYLFREGLAGEHGLSAPHTGAHLIAAWDGVDGLEPTRHAAGGRDLPPIAVTSVGGLFRHIGLDVLAITEDDMTKLLLTPTEAATALGIGRSKV